MKRGTINNTTSSELWVLSAVVFVKKSNPWWLPWKKEDLEIREGVRNWMWESRHSLKLVCLWIGEIEPVDESYFYEHRSFPSFKEATSAATRESRVLEIITNDPNQVSAGVTLWEPSTRKYGR